MAAGDTVGDRSTMRAVRLTAAQGPDGLALEEIARPALGPADALVRVAAAAITRDELKWPQDRLPATPSYELSGTVEALGAAASGIAAGDRVYALAPFDRDGAAAEYIALPADVLAPAPASLDAVEAASVPLAALSAWQGLFEHGGLKAGQRVLIHGAAGGVGHFATQLARWAGAHVIAVTSSGRAESARAPGGDDVRDGAGFDEGLELVDLVFDTVGGSLLERSGTVLRDGGRIVSVAEEPPPGLANAGFFIVEPSREQLRELAGLVDAGDIRPAVDSVFGLEEVTAAYERVMSRRARGKVVLKVAP